MVSTIDTAMGIMLGVAAFLLVLSLVSYRRSGVRSMLLLSEGLSIYVIFTVLLTSVAYATDWLERVDGMLIVIADAVVLGAVLVLGHFGGRPSAGPP